MGAEQAGDNAVRSAGGLAVSCGHDSGDLEAVLPPGKSVGAEDLVEDVSDGVPLAPALIAPAVALAAQVKGGTRKGNKGRNRKGSGQRSVADAKQQLVEDATNLKPVEGGVLLPSSADKEGVVGSKLDPVPGGGGSLFSAHSGKVIQALGVVDAGSVHMDRSEEFVAGEGVSIALDQIATSASVSKVKHKGRAPFSST